MDEVERVWETVPEVFSNVMKYHARKVGLTYSPCRYTFVTQIPPLPLRWTKL